MSDLGNCHKNVFHLPKEANKQFVDHYLNPQHCYLTNLLGNVNWNPAVNRPWGLGWNSVPKRVLAYMANDGLLNTIESHYSVIINPFTKGDE